MCKPTATRGPTGSGMSYQKFNVLRWIRAINDTRGLTQGARSCALSLAQWLNAAGECYPTREQIAEVCGVDKRTASRQLSELESNHLIKRIGGRNIRATHDTTVRGDDTTVMSTEPQNMTPLSGGMTPLSGGMTPLSGPINNPVKQPTKTTQSESARRVDSNLVGENASEAARSDSDSEFESSEREVLHAFDDVGKSSVGMQAVQGLLEHARVLGLTTQDVVDEVRATGDRLRSCSPYRLTGFIRQNLETKSRKPKPKPGRFYVETDKESEIYKRQMREQEWTSLSDIIVGYEEDQ